MTLGELLSYFSQHPIGLILYFTLVPIAAFLAWQLGKDEGHLKPWNGLYCLLVYLSCIPGIFAVALTIYLVVFRKENFLDADIYTQILPIISMFFTLILIKRNVDFDQIPGFRKISGLMISIAAVMAIMLMVEKTRLLVFSYMPISQLLLIFLGALLLVVFGVSRMFKRHKASSTEPT